MKEALYNQKGEKTGTIDLPDSAFGVGWNAALVSQALEALRSNMRRPKAHSKGRGEVRGGGKKPWKQKGTGYARHGSIRSPIWIGGGVTHGPTKDRNYKKKINKKMRRNAFLAVLSEKRRNGEIIFLEDALIKSGKTKDACDMIKNLSKAENFESLARSSLLVFLSGKDELSKRSFKNLKKLEVVYAKDANILDLLSFKYILMPKETLKIFSEKANHKK